jgi:hypothetical protein
MAGRALGQPGNRRAEVYAADALRRAGVPPAVDGSYFHPVRVYQPTLGSGGRLRISRSDGRVVADLSIGRDFHPLPASGARSASGRLVFAGHGISAPALTHDDYAGTDVRGAIALVLDESPARIANDRAIAERERAELASLDRKIADATAHGAAGLVVVKGYLPEVQAAWPESRSPRDASYRLQPQPDHPPVAAVSERAASPIRQALSGTDALQASLTPGVVVEPVTVHNVAGIVEGQDPARTEMLVVGAHLDHDGVDADGVIYNGADDNASGTAAVLEMAAAFARAAALGHRPRRAVVFALWNGEEKGSLGAEAFAASPRPARRIVANLNLDMVGRAEDADPADPRFHGFAKRSARESANLVHLLGYSHAPALARLVLAANEPIGLEIRQDYDRDAQNLIQRSDHWAFLRRGIPAVFLTTGLHPDYHTPADDAERIDYGKLVRITKLASRAAWLAADGDGPL